MTDAQVPTRLNHFTPLRYPGGKAKLAPFIKQIICENDLEDGCYIEPFAGGAAIAVQLLLQGYVSRIIINDLSPPIYAFWHSIKHQANKLMDRIIDVDLSVEEWDKQKQVLRAGDTADLFSLGFAAFYLNRTNRSGVLNGGIIGGRNQQGEWLIDARFNRTELAYRVERIARVAANIDIRCMDAIAFLQDIKSLLPEKSLIYADPPYFEKGRQLYLDYYSKSDHKILADFITTSLQGINWLVSYDDVPEIREIYSLQRAAAYAIPYSVRSSRLGNEIMFYSSELCIPEDKKTGSEVGPADRFLIGVPA